MSNNTTVRARINGQIKDEAANVLSEIGLTISDAFRMLLIRVAREKALPFEPFVPSVKAMAAIEAARKGDLVTIGSLDNLLNELNADD